MHVAVSVAHEADAAPARVADDSIKQLRQIFDGQSSPATQAITDICQRMLSSLLILSPRVVRDTQSGVRGNVGWAISRPIRAGASL